MQLLKLFRPFNSSPICIVWELKHSIISLAHPAANFRLVYLFSETLVFSVYRK